MNEDMPQNIAQTILDQAAREAETRITIEEAHDGTDVAVLVARSGVTAEPIQSKLDAFAAIPRSRAGRVEALDLDSFAALILRDYDAGSVVFADVSGQGVSFAAVLDYHQPFAGTQLRDNPGRDGQRHGREVIVYQPALSDEWKAWTGQSGKGMSQADFAAWIDDRLPDIADPGHLKDAADDSTAVKFGRVYGFGPDAGYGYASPDRMVALSTGFSVREGAAVKSAVNLTSGEVSIQYETTHETSDGGGKPLTVPRRFLLAIPVFAREAPYMIPVRLQYRKQGGSISWSFELYRPEVFRQDAIRGLCEGLAVKLLPEGGTAPVVPVHLAKRAG